MLDVPGEKKATSWQMMVVKKVTAFTLHDCCWKNQLKLMQFQMLNMKSLLESSADVAFAARLAAEASPKWFLYAFNIEALHCTAQHIREMLVLMSQIHIHLQILIHKLCSVSFSHVHLANFKEHLILHCKKIGNNNTSSCVKLFE